MMFFSWFKESRFHATTFELTTIYVCSQLRFHYSKIVSSLKRRFCLKFQCPVKVFNAFICLMKQTILQTNPLNSYVSLKMLLWRWNHFDSSYVYLVLFIYVCCVFFCSTIYFVSHLNAEFISWSHEFHSNSILKMIMKLISKRILSVQCPFG